MSLIQLSQMDTRTCLICFMSTGFILIFHKHQVWSYAVSHGSQLPGHIYFLTNKRLLEKTMYVTGIMRMIMESNLGNYCSLHTPKSRLCLISWDPTVPSWWVKEEGSRTLLTCTFHRPRRERNAFDPCADRQQQCNVLLHSQGRRQWANIYDPESSVTTGTQTPAVAGHYVMPLAHPFGLLSNQIELLLHSS